MDDSALLDRLGSLPKAWKPQSRLSKAAGKLGQCREVGVEEMETDDQGALDWN